MDTGKKTVTAVAIVAVIALVIGVWALVKPTEKTREQPNLALAGQAGNLLLENYDPYARYNGGLRTALGINASSTLEVTGDTQLYGATTLTGTTTPTQLLSPFGGSISTAATGTARTLDANTTGPKLCSLAVAGLSARNTGTFSPSLVVSIGTSTSAVTTTNIIASTTIATSTPGTSFFDTYAPKGTGRFVYQNNDELMAIVGDITNTEASTTHMTNLTLDFRMWCSEIAI